MTSRQVEQRRTASESVSLPALTAQALAAVQAAGLDFESLELNAGFRRKPRQAHLWYVADTGVGRNGQPWLMVTAGNAKITGDVSTPLVVYKSWEAGGATIDPAEVADIRRQTEEAFRRRREEGKARRGAAAQQARARWSNASAQVNGHPYLAAKGIKAHGVRRSGDRLLIPVTDAAGTVHGIQAIGPDGVKRFNTGATVAGHFHLIGTPAGRLYLCEGYATGATIHEATGAAVAVAFHAGNLKAVAKILREAHPGAELVVCADDDRHTEGNPGLTHARAASAAVDGLLAVPRFRHPGTQDTDFNDLARSEGLGAVRSQLQKPGRVEAVTTGLSVVCADRLPPEPVAWLWEGWLARGKVHLLAGAPGTGKTSVALALAATLTTAGRWPDGSVAAAGSVLIWSGEDDPRDTLVPRLIACGADLSRIHFVGSVTEQDGIRAFDPARDADLLRDHAAAMNPPPVLLIVDPIVSAVAGDSHKNAEVRRGLQPLVDLATAVRCVVLGISHFTKGTAGRDPVERVTGSLAFGALARVVLAAAKLSEEDGGGRILARTKNNLGPDAGGFTYDLEPLELPSHPGVHTTRILWGAPLEGTARELLGKAESVDDPDERSALEDAKAWLRHTLSFGALNGKELKRLARVEGIPERTLYRAAGALGVDRRAQGFGKARLWSMSANEKVLAETGRHGEDVPVSANRCQTQSVGTHAQFGTHGEGETAAGPLRQEGEQEGCQPESLTSFADVGPLRREAEPFVEEF
jgi:putative DNA primase/helicase